MDRVRNQAAVALQVFLETEIEQLQSLNRPSIINCTYQELQDFAVELGVELGNIAKYWKDTVGYRWSAENVKLVRIYGDIFSAFLTTPRGTKNKKRFCKVLTFYRIFYWIGQ